MSFSIKYLCLLAACISLATAQSIAQLFATLPPCALDCTIPTLLQANCSLIALPDLASCLCRNFTAQRNISSCVQLSCNHTEQVVVVEANSLLCDGYPIPSRSEELQITSIVLIAISIPFVLLRMLSRILISNKIWWDDWALAVASILLLATLAIEIPMAQKGFGRHIWNLNPLDIPVLQKLFYITQIFYVCVQVFTKVSLLVCFLRIFPQLWFKRVTLASIIFILSHGIIYGFLVALQCLPVQSIWDPTIPAQCLNRTAIIITGAGFSIFEDFLILMLPIPCIKSLKLKIGKRLSLAVMFSIGSFACVTSMIRLKHLIGFGDFTDSSWDNVDTSIWSSIEIATAVICACLPALRPILMIILPRNFGKSAKNDSNTPLEVLNPDIETSGNLGSENGKSRVTADTLLGNKGAARRWSDGSEQLELFDRKKEIGYRVNEKPLPDLPK